MKSSILSRRLCHSRSARARKYGSQPTPDSASTSVSSGCRSSAPQNIMIASGSSSCSGSTRGERGRLPLPHLVAEPRRRPALDVEADGEAGVLGGGPQPVPRPVAEVDVEDVDDRAAVAELRAALQLRRRGLGRVAGQEREHAQPIGSDRVELLDRPVVPRRVAAVLQLGVDDREPERERSVDHRGRQAVAVHVLQPQRRGTGAVAVVVDAGAPDRAQALQEGAVRAGSRCRPARGLRTPTPTRRRARPRAVRARRRRAAAVTRHSSGGTARRSR